MEAPFCDEGPGGGPIVERSAFEFWPGMAAGDRPVRGMLPLDFEVVYRKGRRGKRVSTRMSSSPCVLTARASVRPFGTIFERCPSVRRSPRSHGFAYGEGTPSIHSDLPSTRRSHETCISGCLVRGAASVGRSARENRKTRRQIGRARGPRLGSCP